MSKFGRRRREWSRELIEHDPDITGARLGDVRDAEHAARHNVVALFTSRGSPACASSQSIGIAARARHSASPRAPAAASPAPAATRTRRPPRPRSAPGPAATRPIPAAAADFKPWSADTLSVVTSLPGPGFWEGSDSDPTKLTSGYEYDIAKCMETDVRPAQLQRAQRELRCDRRGLGHRTTTSRSRRCRSPPSGRRSCRSRSRTSSRSRASS